MGNQTLASTREGMGGKFLLIHFLQGAVDGTGADGRNSGARRDQRAVETVAAREGFVQGVRIAEVGKLGRADEWISAGGGGRSFPIQPLQEQVRRDIADAAPFFRSPGFDAAVEIVGDVDGGFYRRQVNVVSCIGSSCGYHATMSLRLVSLKSCVGRVVHLAAVTVASHFLAAGWAAHAICKSSAKLAASSLLPAP